MNDNEEPVSRAASPAIEEQAVAPIAASYARVEPAKEDEVEQIRSHTPKPAWADDGDGAGPSEKTGPKPLTPEPQPAPAPEPAAPIPQQRPKSGRPLTAKSQRPKSAVSIRSIMEGSPEPAPPGVIEDEPKVPKQEDVYKSRVDLQSRHSIRSEAMIDDDPSEEQDIPMLGEDKDKEQPPKISEQPTKPPKPSKKKAGGTEW